MSVRFCGTQAMDGTTKRLRIADVIANMFRSVLALSPGVAAACSRRPRLCATMQNRSLPATQEEPHAAEGQPPRLVTNEAAHVLRSSSCCCTTSPRYFTPDSSCSARRRHAGNSVPDHRQNRARIPAGKHDLVNCG